MKEIPIKIDDEIFRQASHRVENLEAEVCHHVTEYLASISADDKAILAARSRMAELFRTKTNFSVDMRPAREDMHER